jgi:hypothetical protein
MVYLLWEPKFEFTEDGVLCYASSKVPTNKALLQS